MFESLVRFFRPNKSQNDLSEQKIHISSDKLISELFTAIADGNTAKIKNLLQSHIDLSKTKEGLTALEYAASIGNLPVLKLIIQAWPLPYQQDQFQQIHYLFKPEPKQIIYDQALLIAASLNATETAITLLNAGANPNGIAAKNRRTGNSPLHEAVIHNNDELIEALYQKGADSNVTNVAGFKPNDYLLRTQVITFKKIYHALRDGQTGWSCFKTNYLNGKEHLSDFEFMQQTITYARKYPNSRTAVALDLASDKANQKNCSATNVQLFKNIYQYSVENSGGPFGFFKRSRILGPTFYRNASLKQKLKETFLTSELIQTHAQNGNNRTSAICNALAQPFNSNPRLQHNNRMLISQNAHDSNVIKDNANRLFLPPQQKNSSPGEVINVIRAFGDLISTIAVHR